MTKDEAIKRAVKAARVSNHRAIALKRVMCPALKQHYKCEINTRKIAMKAARDIKNFC